MIGMSSPSPTSSERVAAISAAVSAWLIRQGLDPIDWRVRDVQLARPLPRETHDE